MNIYEFAAQIGVSIGTVSRAINNRPGINPDTREMVLRRMTELGFNPNRTATSLASGRTRTAVLWTPGLESSYVGDILIHLEHTLEASEYDLVIADIERKQGDPARLDALLRWPADCIFILDGEKWLGDFIKRNTPHIPLVSMGLYPCSSVDHVQIRVDEGVTHAIEHLAEEGCQRIAFMAPHIYMHEHEPRYCAYMNTMNHLGKQPELIKTEHLFRIPVIHTLRSYLNEHGCPDGLLCFNDDYGIAVYRELRSMGYRIPDDILLVGCDGIVETEYLEHPLSTIAMPMKEMCESGWKLIENRMIKPKRSPQSIQLSAHLEIRETSKRQN